MPGITGDEVLAHITDTESACRTAMITAVEPDFEILELGFDDYLVKPLFQDELADTVERLLERATYNREVRRYFSLASKRALLRAHKTDAELAQSDTYAELTDDLDALGERLDRTMAGMDREDFDAAFARL